MAYEIGAFNRPWNTLSYEESLWGIAEAGFRWTGLMRQQGKLLLDADTPPDRLAYLKEAIDENGLRMSTVLSTIDLSEGVEEAVQSIGRLLRNVAAVGASYFLSCGTNEGAKRDEYYEVMRRAAEIGTELGVMVTLKPHGGISSSGADLAWAAETIDHPNFGIYYDPGNMIYYDGLDPVKEAEICAPYVVAMCFKDCVKMRGDTDILPGEGAVDFKAVIEVLVNGGFTDGPVLVECLGGDGYDEITRRAKDTYAFMNSLLN